MSEAYYVIESRGDLVTHVGFSHKLLQACVIDCHSLS